MYVVYITVIYRTHNVLYYILDHSWSTVVNEGNLLLRSINERILETSIIKMSLGDSH